jgi:hypothetical protein
LNQYKKGVFDKETESVARVRGRRRHGGSLERLEGEVEEGEVEEGEVEEGEVEEGEVEEGMQV